MRNITPVVQLISEGHAESLDGHGQGSTAGNGTHPLLGTAVIPDDDKTLHESHVNRTTLGRQLIQED